MNKQLFWILAALLIAGLILSACQPAATEAPAEVEEPTEEVVAEQPTNCLLYTSPSPRDRS